MKTGLYVHSRRGFYLIGLLIVIAIILTLGYSQMHGVGGSGGEQFAIDRSKETACTVNRSTLVSSLAIWRTTHSNEPFTLESVAKTGTNIPTCPAGGKYSLSADGATIYCSIHNPDPAVKPAAK
ncbi:TPA: hypothetical protein DDW35_01945 [Candidatus Sumerlaeota bacterium]|jgi:hypothetical protein|nr:hypothetical protein [Candidatus Sumerlaeota bacterium]